MSLSGRVAIRIARSGRGRSSAEAVAIALLLALFVLALLANLIAPYGQEKILTDTSFAPISGSMWLGGDFLGRDLLSRLIYGLRVTFLVAIAISLLTFLLGGTLGFLAVILGGWVDAALSRIMDIFISFPSIMLALIVISGLGSSTGVLIVTVSCVEATRVFRIARAVGQQIVVQDYVQAARLRGEGLAGLMWHEILPNAAAPLAAEFGIRFTYAILFVSALSFLGLGVQPPQADLGVMVRENMTGLLYGSGAPVFPALCIAVITLAVNLLVDWHTQRDAFALQRQP